MCFNSYNNVFHGDNVEHLFIVKGGDKMKTEKWKLLHAILPIVILDTAEKHTIHGYEIIKKMRNEYHIYLSASTIYPCLQELEKEGLLVSKWEISERPRKIYSITNKGKTQKMQDMTLMTSLPILRKV